MSLGMPRSPVSIPPESKRYGLRQDRRRRTRRYDNRQAIRRGRRDEIVLRIRRYKKARLVCAKRRACSWEDSSANILHAPSRLIGVSASPPPTRRAEWQWREKGREIIRRPSAVYYSEGFRGVDKIVDVGFQEFNTLQQSATRSRHLLEKKSAENRPLCARAGIRLGHRCAPFRRICRFNNLENRACRTLWNLEESMSTISTTISCARNSWHRKFLESKAPTTLTVDGAHLLLGQGY